MGEHCRLVGELEAAVAAEPLRERRLGLATLAFYRCGRQAHALRAFSRLRKTLREELGISPSAELAALEQSILEQSLALELRRPAAEAASWPRGRGIPSPASSFVGRSDERAELSSLIGYQRLVTLAGAAGCGKTRLALAVASAVQDRFPGGAFFVALGLLSDDALVPQAVADALGVRSSPGAPWGLWSPT